MVDEYGLSIAKRLHNSLALPSIIPMRMKHGDIHKGRENEETG